METPVYYIGSLRVFPEVVWLEILDKVAHSQDIHSVFMAFPELDKTFQRKKAHWLFDQVLPHLMTKHLVIEKEFLGQYRMDSRELLKLRLVSKRWKKAVELSLQNHADRHPINSENGMQPALSPVGLPVNHFNYNRINKYHLGATLFQSPSQITDFLVEMTNFKGNPFPVKHVYIEIHRYLADSYWILIMKAVELLKKFGEHVVILEMEIGDDSDDRCHLGMCIGILYALSLVPNLESLKLWGRLDNNFQAADEYFKKEAGNMDLFPKLEKLKSFDWQVNMNFERCWWVDRMIDFYGGGRGGHALRKLALDHKYWNVEMAANLNHLTELHLLLDEEKKYEVEDVRNVLGMFRDGQLKRFCLTDYPLVKYDREIYIDELIGILGEFKIESVVLEKLELKEKPSKLGAVGGIISLHLDDGVGLSYEFLKRLSNLRFLSVHVKDLTEYLTPENERNDHDFAFMVRQYFWSAHKEYEFEVDFEIWKECKKLESLSVAVTEAFNVFDIRFVRETGNKPFWGWTGREFAKYDEEVRRRSVERLEEEDDLLDL